MKFWCSKIRINGKEVIKSGLLFGRKLEWRKDGTRAVKSNHVIGVLWGYLWDSPTAILQVKHENKPNLLF